MGTLKEYIKMCERAEEIQSKWKPISGDVIRHIITRDILIVDNFDKLKDKTRITICGHCSLLYVLNDESIWLPRQDQLQEMIKMRFQNHLWSMAIYFGEWLQNKENFAGLSPIDNKSMEQLWLAFVMKEKYNKIWNGKNWINE